MSKKRQIIASTQATEWTPDINVSNAFQTVKKQTVKSKLNLVLFLINVIVLTSYISHKQLIQFGNKYHQTLKYVDQMHLDDVSIPHSTATAENFYLYPAINKQSWISAFVTKSIQKVGVYFRVPKKEYGEMMYQYLLEHKTDIVSQIGEDAIWSNNGEGREKYITLYMAVDDVHAESNRAAIFEFYNTNINNFANAFRPLLKDYEP